MKFEIKFLIFSFPSQTWVAAQWKGPRKESRDNESHPDNSFYCSGNKDGVHASDESHFSRRDGHKEKSAQTFFCRFVGVEIYLNFIPRLRFRAARRQKAYNVTVFCVGTDKSAHFASHGINYRSIHALAAGIFPTSSLFQIVSLQIVRQRDGVVCKVRTKSLAQSGLAQYVRCFAELTFNSTCTSLASRARKLAFSTQWQNDRTANRRNREAKTKEDDDVQQKDLEILLLIWTFLCFFNPFVSILNERGYISSLCEFDQRTVYFLFALSSFYPSLADAEKNGERWRAGELFLSASASLRRQIFRFCAHIAIVAHRNPVESQSYTHIDEPVQISLIKYDEQMKRDWDKCF